MASANKKTASTAKDDAPANDTREPVTVRGLDLLKLIEATGGAYLTQDEGKEAVDAGNAIVNMDNAQGNTAFVTLTEAGKALLADAASESKPVFEIDDYVPPMPEKKRRGKGGSKYPFDALKVGQSFHVPVTANMPNPVSAIASSLTGARRKYEVPMLDANGKPVFETVTVKTYAKDTNGKRIKGADGKFVVSGETSISREKMVQTRDFQIFEADKADPRGPGARVVRTK